MKRIFISSVFLFIFSVAMFAQTNVTLPCPTLFITSPAISPQPDEPATFTAKIGEVANKYDLKYLWSVSNGKIIEGQKTLSVKVLPTDTQEFYAKGLTAKIEVIGLPKNCEDTASETTSLIETTPATLLDEFSISASRIDKARLDNLVNELQNNPTARGYIIEKFEPKTSANEGKLKIRKLSDYLFKIKKIEKDRIVIRYTNAVKTHTQFFIVPAGAKSPDCKGCYP